MLGTLLACLMTLVYGLLARGGQRSAYVIWVALAAIVGLGLTVSSITGMLTVVICVDAALVLMLVALQPRTAAEPPVGRSSCGSPARLARPHQRGTQPLPLLRASLSARRRASSRPVPTETSSGTVRSAAPPISRRTISSSGLALTLGDLEHELVVHLQQHP